MIFPVTDASRSSELDARELPRDSEAVGFLVIVRKKEKSNSSSDAWSREPAPHGSRGSR